MSTDTQPVVTVSPIKLDDLAAIVRLGDHFTQDDVVRLLRQRRKGRVINVTYINRYIERGEKLGLFKKINTHYQRLQEGLDLASISDHSPEWKSFLHELLLRDKVYQNFIALLRQYPRFEKFGIIERAGGWIGRPGRKDNHTTPKALRGWAEELGVIAKLKPSKKYILVDQARQLTSSEFWDKLVAVYKSVLDKERRHTFGLRIPLVREEFCFVWRVHPDYFDQCLNEIVNSQEYAPLIQLSGAPARYARELERNGYIPITIGKKQYMYIEIFEKR